MSLSLVQKSVLEFAIYIEMYRLAKDLDSIIAKHGKDFKFWPLLLSRIIKTCTGMVGWNWLNKDITQETAITNYVNKENLLKIYAREEKRLSETIDKNALLKVKDISEKLLERY